MELVADPSVVEGGGARNMKSMEIFYDLFFGGREGGHAPSSGSAIGESTV